MNIVYNTYAWKIFFILREGKFVGLFKCRLCGRVYSTDAMSTRKNLCCECFMRLEDMYAVSGIHDYIRDYGLSEDFDKEELARKLKMNPRSIQLLYEMGFFDRDIQVYSHEDKERRRALSEELLREIEILKRAQQPEPEIKITPKKISYGGRAYRRRRRF